MSLTRTMTTAPVFHRYDTVAGIRLGVENIVANQWASVVSFLVEGCRRTLVLDEQWLHVLSLHLGNWHELTCYQGLSYSSISE